MRTDEPATQQDDTETRLQDLEQRVQRLEAHSPPTGTDPQSETSQVFWALQGLRQRVPELSGAVMMVGTVTAPNGHSADWQYTQTTEALFAGDFAARAEVLSAIAHPIRLTLLQRLLTDAETVNDLQRTGEFGTTGQIYHHLRQLVSAGWLRTTGHGRYEVPAQRLVPLLTMLTGADR